MNTSKALPVLLSLPGFLGSAGSAGRFGLGEGGGPDAFRQQLSEMLGALEAGDDAMASAMASGHPLAALAQLLGQDAEDLEGLAGLVGSEDLEGLLQPEGLAALEALLVALANGQDLPEAGRHLPGSGLRTEELGALLARDGDAVTALRAWLQSVSAAQGGGIIDASDPERAARHASVLEALRALGRGELLADGRGALPPGSALLGGVADAGADPELAARYSKLMEALRALAPGQSASGGVLPPAFPGAQEGSVREWLAQMAGSSDERPASNLAALLTAGAAVPAAGSATPATALATPAGPVPFRGMGVDLPLQDPGWDRALGERVRWMVGQNLQAAELRLNPPDLGPLEVRLRMDGDRTHVNFVVAHSSVRDAVDAALPRLRELFMDGGLNLGQVSVSERDSGGKAGADANGGNASGGQGGPGGAGDAETDPQAATVRVARGLVDDYA